jgi:hypothetical protein
VSGTRWYTFCLSVNNHPIAYFVSHTSKLHVEMIRKSVSFTPISSTLLCWLQFSRRPASSPCSTNFLANSTRLPK